LKTSKGVLPASRWLSGKKPPLFLPAATPHRSVSGNRPFAEQPVLIGYRRLSKANSSQTLDLQRDALLAVGVEPGYLYED
jgi:hypothetical protein